MMANLIQERPGARILAEIRTLLALRVSPQEIGVLFRTLAQLPVTPPRTIALLTIHQAKGCDWRVVFLVSGHMQELASSF